MTRVAVDTNILVYAEGIERAPGDARKVTTSRSLLRRIHQSGAVPVIALQSLAELHYVLVRRGHRSPLAAAEAVGLWRHVARVAIADETIFDATLELTSAHNLQIFDAVILASVVDQADILVSEDMQDGFAWRGLTIVNPFGPEPDERIVKWLGDPTDKIRS